VKKLRTPDDLSLPSAKSKPGELKMAVSLINQLTKPFDIKKYKDDYSEKLLKIIKAKSKGKSPSFHTDESGSFENKGPDGTIKSQSIQT
jgi:DNA end-binding protein Ku